MENFHVWGSYFYSTVVENHKEIANHWAPYLKDDSYFSASDWTLAETKSTIRNKKNKELPWDIFFSSIEPHLNSYLENLDPQVSYNVLCDEHWLNVYNKGDYQEAHDHAFPGRCVSAIYLLEYPDDEKDPGGALVFECPSFQTVRSSGMDRIFNAYNYQHITPRLSSGVLILFPSWISHYVLPSKSSKLRASIAANFVIQEQADE